MAKFGSKSLSPCLIFLHGGGFSSPIPTFCQSGAFMTARLKISRLIVFLFFLSFTPAASYSYSFLTHQAIIDTTWNDGIKPQLLKRYPQATEEQLREARAYVYGGAIIQDMGYYPFGSKFFTDLVHYVRSGDFIENLVQEASN